MSARLHAGPPPPPPPPSSSYCHTSLRTQKCSIETLWDTTIQLFYNTIQFCVSSNRILPNFSYFTLIVMGMEADVMQLSPEA